jgi:phage regulator Rha-like protein
MFHLWGIYHRLPTKTVVAITIWFVKQVIEMRHNMAKEGRKDRQKTRMSANQTNPVSEYPRMKRRPSTGRQCYE